MEQYNDNQVEIEEEIYNKIINLEDFKKEFKEKFAEYIDEKESEDFKDFLRDELIKKLKIISENYSFTVLKDFFQILINLWITKIPEKSNPDFLSMEEIYDIFFAYDFRTIPLNTINDLIGALQWNLINSEWIDDNFILEYFETLPENLDEKLKIRTWNLVELTRIKSKELI